MKLIRFAFISCFCLNFNLLVSSQSISAILENLIEVDQEAKNVAYQSIYEQYTRTLSETETALNTVGVPRLNETYNNLNEYVSDLEDQISSAGYDPSICRRFIEGVSNNISQVTSITNLIAKAAEEKKYIYDYILENIYYIGSNSLEVIHQEVSSIITEYHICVDADYPSNYCVNGLSKKMLEKGVELPYIYSRETEAINVNLIKQGLVYQTRIQEYIEQAIQDAKPYISLLESCIQRLIRVSETD